MRDLERFEYCELCRHFKTVKIDEGEWDKECDKWLEPAWDDEEECFVCDGWERQYTYAERLSIQLKANFLKYKADLAENTPQNVERRQS